MNKGVLYSISTLLLAFVLTACGEQNNNNFAMGFEGMYVGELPCADCPGILTHTSFFPDSTVAITSLYYDSDDTSETEWGTWSVADKVLKAQMKDKSEYYYIQLSDSKIVMTDSLGNPSELLPLESYQLSKTKELIAEDFAGRFVSGNKDNSDAYRQNLVIDVIDTDKVAISITSEGAGKGCSFVGEGKLINNQIEVDMSHHHEKFISTMVIRFDTDKQTLILATSRFEDRYDLMYFCGGGGSLAGDYTRSN